MISFDLRCTGDHVFEAWFRSGADYAEQAAAGQLICPTCGSSDVVKAAMAPNVGAKGNADVPRLSRPGVSAPPPVTTTTAPSIPPALQAAMAVVAAAQAANLPRSRWVGGDFAKEARAIHARAQASKDDDAVPETPIIHGQATRAEAEALIEDGISVMPLLVPFVPPEARN